MKQSAEPTRANNAIFTLFSFVLVAGTIMTSRSAAAQTAATPPPVFEPITDGTIQAFARHCNVLFVGGHFTQVASAASAGTVLDKSSGAILSGFPSINGPVHVAISDGAGGFYIGGKFSKVGHHVRRGVARILFDGTVDPAFDVNVSPVAEYVFTWMGQAYPSTGQAQVNALVLDNGRLYIGGWFSKINGGLQRRSLAAVYAGNGVATSFNPDVLAEGGIGFSEYPGDVTALLVTNNLVFAGGVFSRVNSTTPGSPSPKLRPMLVQFDAETGFATGWNPNAGTAYAENKLLAPRALAIRGPDLFVAGGSVSSSHSNFIGDQKRVAGLAKIELESGGVLPWNPDFGTFWEGTVHSLAVVGSTVYVAGKPNPSYSHFSPNRRLAAIHAVTAAVQDWAPEDGSDPGALNRYNTDAMVLDKDTLYTSFEGRVRAVERLSGELRDWRPAVDLEGRFGDRAPPRASGQCASPATRFFAEETFSPGRPRPGVTWPPLT